MNSLWKPSLACALLLFSGAGSLAKTVYWAVPTSADLVARSPASYATSNGDPSLVFLQVVTTSGDTVVGAGARHWKWDATATGLTNTAKLGGPIAWPFGSSAGRWVQVQAASLAKPDVRWMTLPGLFPDPPDGTTNPGNPTSHFQRHIDAASAAFDPVWGRIRLDFPAGTFSCDELIWKGRVIYVSDHEWHCRKRNDSLGMANRSIMRTQRVNGMITDPVDGAFVAWAKTPVDYSNPDNWYGLSDDVTITGQGKFVFDQNGKNSALPLCRLSEIRRWLVDSNCFEVIHNGTPTTLNNWAISISGRDVQWFGPVVRGGLYTWQDGLHICTGKNITVTGGYLESGDDAVSIEAEAAGGSTSPPDEAAEQITVSGFTTKSNAARAVSVCGGINQINVPYINGLRVRNVVVTNFTGTCSLTRQSAFLVGSYPFADGIWDYTIDSPGNGYTDGYYVRDLSSNGGGFGAQCHVKVSGGRIVRAVIANVAGAFQMGEGYTGNETVNLTGMGLGIGGKVTGKVFGLPNDRVTGVVIRDFSVVSGGPQHDGIEAFGVNIRGASDVSLSGTIRIIENSTLPSHRPFSIVSCSNVVLNLDVSGTQKGGSINTKVFPNSVVDELYFRNCTFGYVRTAGNGIFKINGTNNHRIHVQDCTFSAIPNGMTAFYLPDFESGTPDSTEYLDVSRCRFLPESPSPSKVRILDFVPLPGGHGNQVGFLRFVDNLITGPTVEDSPDVVQASCASYLIDRNQGGFRTRTQSVITLGPGATTSTVLADTYTGLPDAGPAGLGGVTVSSVGTPGVLHWIQPRNSLSFDLKAGSASASPVSWSVGIDTSRKPMPSLLHFWNFNEPAALMEPRIGTGSPTLALSPGPGTVLQAEIGREFTGANLPPGEVAGSHLQIINPFGAVLEARIPTVGVRNVEVQYETRRSLLGPALQHVAYTADGVTFVPFQDVAVPDGPPVVVTLDFSNLVASQDNPQFAIRITFEAGAGGIGVDNCIDNLSVTGTLLPGAASGPLPRLSATPLLTASPATPFNLNLSPTSTSAGIFRFLLVGGPDGLTMSDAGILAWTPSALLGGTVNPAYVRVSSPNSPGAFSLARLDLSVPGGGNSPVLSQPADQVVNELAQLSLPLSATPGSIGGGNLTFSLANGPGGMTVSPSGLLLWTPTEIQGPGVFSVTVRVTDSQTPPLSDNRTFQVTVNEVNSPPVLTKPADRSLAELSALSFNLSGSDVDLPSQALTYSLISGPDGLTVSATGQVNWIPSELQGPGTYPVTIRVSDQGVPPLTDQKSFVLSVTESNSPPSLVAPANATLARLSTLSITLAATDSDLPAQSIIYSLASGPAGMTVTPAGVLSWTPPATLAAGVYPVTVQATDSGIPPQKSQKTFSVTVTAGNTAPRLARPADQNLNELVPWTMQLSATDDDKPAQVLSYSLVSGPPGTTVGASGLVSWTPTERQGPGTYSLTVKVSDNATPPLSDTQTFNITVGEVNSTPKLVNPGNKTVPELSLFTLNLAASDTDFPAQTLVYSLVDGPAGLSISDSGVLTWTPGEEQGPGTYVVQIEVTDNGVPPLSDALSFNITVSETNSAPVLGALPDTSVDELNLLALQLTATDSDLPAQPLIYSLVSGPPGLVVTATGSLTWTPNERQGGATYPVTVKVSDNGKPSLSDTRTFGILVNETGVETRTLWQIGVDDDPNILPYNPSKEFSVGTRRNDAPPGVVTRRPLDPEYLGSKNPTADDDFYTAGTYPIGFNGLKSVLKVPFDEPASAWESSHNPRDRTNRIHFILGTDQFAPRTGLRLTLEFPTGGKADKPNFGVHDMVVRLRNSGGTAVTLLSQRLSGPTNLSLSFVAAAVGATTGPNTIEVVRTGPGDSEEDNSIQYDFVRLESITSAPSTNTPPPPPDPGPVTLPTDTTAPLTTALTFLGTGGTAAPLTSTGGGSGSTDIPSDSVIRLGGLTYRVLTYGKPDAQRGKLRYLVEGSSDLQHWRIDETEEIGRKSNGKWVNVSVRDRLSLEEIPTRRLRLRILPEQWNGSNEEDGDSKDREDDRKGRESD